MAVGDRFLKLLYTLGMTDKSGRLRAECRKLPPMPSNKNLTEELNRQWVVKRGCGFSWREMLQEVFESHKSLQDAEKPLWNMRISVALSGSAVGTLMRRTGIMGEMFRALLGEQASLVPIELFETAVPDPDDFDIRVQFSGNLQATFVTNASGALKNMIPPQFVEKYFMQMQYPNRMAAIGIRGEGEPATEFIFWQLLGREHLFTADKVRILFSELNLQDSVAPCRSIKLEGGKKGLRDNWQAFIDDHAALCRVESPETINAMGWFKLLSKRCRGKVLALDEGQDKKVEATLLNTCFSL
ncbi:MAG: hypothetical protein KDK48_04500, partial [Chlamydiia bacterium]|nr:hypothetical protein [Chlamydiia bacterium]